MRRWLACGALFVLTALGLWLRLRHYGARIPWVDEVETHLYAESNVWAPFRRAFTGPPVTTPPLYFAIVRVLARLHLAGAHERLPSVICGAAAIPAVFSLVRRVSVLAGLGAAALLCFSPLHVLYSQEARPYALLVLATIVFLDGAERARQGRATIVFAIAGATCALTQHAGVPLAAVGIAWLLWARRDPGAIVACAIIAAACAITTVQLFIGVHGGAALMPHVGGIVLPARGERALGLLVSLGTGDPDRPRAGLVLSLALWIGGAFVLVRRAPHLARLWLAAALVPVAVMAIPPTRYSFFARYAIHALPIGVALGGVAIAALAEHRTRLFSLLPLVAWLALSMPRVDAADRALGTRYDLVGAALHDAPPHARIVMRLYDEPLPYYAPQELGALRPYLRRDLELRAVSAWEDAPIAPTDYVITIAQPWADAGMRALRVFAPAETVGPIDCLVLGRTAASTTLYLYAPDVGVSPPM